MKHDVLDWHGEKKETREMFFFQFFNFRFRFLFVSFVSKKTKNEKKKLTLFFLPSSSSQNFFKTTTGDHLHTNYHTLFTFLRSKGYFVDILGLHVRLLQRGGLR